MKLSEIVERLHLEVKAGRHLLDREVTGGFVSDVLSIVLTHAAAGNIWVTHQVHLNIIPIAGAKEVSAIIIVKNRMPDEDTLKKAEEDKMPVLSTGMNAFQVVGKLYQMGIRESEKNV